MLAEIVIDFLPKDFLIQVALLPGLDFAQFFFIVSGEDYNNKIHGDLTLEDIIEKKTFVFDAALELEEDNESLRGKLAVEKFLLEYAVRDALSDVTKMSNVFSCLNKFVEYATSIDYNYLDETISLWIRELSPQVYRDHYKTLSQSTRIQFCRATYIDNSLRMIDVKEIQNLFACTHQIS